MNKLQKRTPEAISADINLLVGLGYQREKITPPSYVIGSNFMYYKLRETPKGETYSFMFVPKKTDKVEFLDNPTITKDMFDKEGFPLSDNTSAFNF